MDSSRWKQEQQNGKQPGWGFVLLWKVDVWAKHFTRNYWENNLLSDFPRNKNLHHKHSLTHTKTHTPFLSSQSPSLASFQPHRAAVCELHAISGLIKEACFHTSEQQPTDTQPTYTPCQLWSFIHIQVRGGGAHNLEKCLPTLIQAHSDGWRRKMKRVGPKERCSDCLCLWSRALRHIKEHESSQKKIQQHFSRWRGGQSKKK